MTKLERISVLARLPEFLQEKGEIDTVFTRAFHGNNFFIPEFCEKALQNILSWHTESVLNAWLANIPMQTAAKRVGVVLAGNIPMVGWHDLLCTFAAGHISIYKPSVTDTVLIEWLVRSLVEIEPRCGSYFQKAERLNGVDALIATGSNNTAGHFNYYFRNIPRLIRGSKTSLAVVYGFENPSDLHLLADDIMLYFGMGCRNVTKILVPAGYNFSPLFEAIERYKYLTDSHKYINNCIYHKSIFLMNQDPFLESDTITIRAEKSVFSPVGVLNYEIYHSMEEARAIVHSHKPDLQCVISHGGEFENSLPAGSAQSPKVDQYADGENTLEFLLAL